MSAKTVIQPSDENTWIPAPRFRGDKLRGNDNRNKDTKLFSRLECIEKSDAETKS
jgi:hypothetical protein